MSVGSNAEVAEIDPGERKYESFIKMFDHNQKNLIADEEEWIDRIDDYATPPTNYYRALQYSNDFDARWED
jgi:hypothetical protein